MNPPPDVSAWDPWSPEEVAERLGSIDLPWAVVGGYAIDLWLGRTTRDHSDLEIAVLRPDFPRFRSCFPDHTVYAAGNGELHPLPDGEATPEDMHQNWILDEEKSAWRLDIMLEPGGSRRPGSFVRNRSIQRPRSAMIGPPGWDPLPDAGRSPPLQSEGNPGERRERPPERPPHSLSSTEELAMQRDSKLCIRNIDGEKSSNQWNHSSQSVVYKRNRSTSP